MKPDFNITDFHTPTSNSHPADSIGNHGIIYNGNQVGSIEIKRDGSSTFNDRKGNTY